MHGMGMDASCCQTRGSNTAATPVPLFSPEHSQKLADAPHQTSLELSAVAAVGHCIASDAPPPKFPPGGAFALRI